MEDPLGYCIFSYVKEFVVVQFLLCSGAAISQTYVVAITFHSMLPYDDKTVFQ